VTGLLNGFLILRAWKNETRQEAMVDEFSYHKVPFKDYAKEY
jgi:hypothetical protein